MTGEFREPPQEMIRKCACGREITGIFYGYKDAEIGCLCGRLGEWKWELRWIAELP